MQENLFLFTGWIASFFTTNDHVIHAVNYAGHLVLVAIIVLIVAKFATKNLQLVPRGTQNILEAYLEGVVSMGKDVLGSEALSRKYLPLVATIGLIVFVSNIIGIIPGFEAPTSSLNLTLLWRSLFLYFITLRVLDKTASLSISCTLWDRTNG